MAEQAKGKGKMIAIGIFAILIIGTIGAVVLLAGGKGDEGDGEGGPGPDGFEPYVIGPNSHVTNTPEANNEPAVAVNPTDPDNIVAGSNDYGTPSGDAWCGFYSTRAGGRTWRRGLIPGYNGDRSSPLWRFGGAGDPVLAFAQDGTCYMAGIAFERDDVGKPLQPGAAIFVARSDNGGETFPQVSMVIQSRATFTVFHDKEWVCVDPTNGDVHVTWTAFVGLVTANIMHSRSTDRGQTWSRPQIISELSSFELSVQGSQCEVDAAGVLHVSWIDFGSGTLRYTRSADKGASFSAVRDIGRVVEIPYTLPNGQFRTPTMCDMDVDRSGGNRSGSVYIAWPDYSSGDADILFVASYDNGDTWTPPARVNQDEVGNRCDQWFPAVCVGSDGSFQAFYYDRRDDVNNTLISAYVSISYDGGATFTDIQLCDTQFNGDHTRGPFIGDYLAIDDGPGWSVAVWCDAREGTSQTVQSDIWCGFFRWAPEESDV